MNSGDCMNCGAASCPTPELTFANPEQEERGRDLETMWTDSIKQRESLRVWDHPSRVVSIHVQDVCFKVLHGQVCDLLQFMKHIIEREREHNLIITLKRGACKILGYLDTQRMVSMISRLIESQGPRSILVALQNVHSGEALKDDIQENLGS